MTDLPLHGPNPPPERPLRYLTLDQEREIPAGTPNVYRAAAVAQIVADADLMRDLLPEGGVRLTVDGRLESYVDLDHDPFCFPGVAFLIAASWEMGVDFRAAAAGNAELLERLADTENPDEIFERMSARVARWTDADWQRGLGLVTELDKRREDDDGA